MLNIAFRKNPCHWDKKFDDILLLAIVKSKTGACLEYGFWDPEKTVQMGICTIRGVFMI